MYKFRDDSERTEDIFKSRKVWLSLPNQLNDPLECQSGHIPADWKTATISSLESGQLMGMIGLPGLPLPETLFSLNERQTREWLTRFKGLSHRQ